MANNAFVIISQGTVLRDPKQFQTANDQTGLKIAVAVQTTKKKEGEQYAQSDFYDVTVTGKQAEYLLDKVKAKTKLYVDGELLMGDPWTDQKGVAHVNPKVYARVVRIQGEVTASAPKPQPREVVNTDDMPF